MSRTDYIYGMDAHPESIWDRIFAGFDDVFSRAIAWLVMPRLAVA